MPEITRKDIDNLADIAWWLEGYITLAEAEGINCQFKRDHIESLSKVRLEWKRQNG